MRNSSLQILKLQILNNNQDLQLLDRFNGSDDFLMVMERYLMDIFQHIRRNTDHLGNEKITSLASPPIINNEYRILHGFFSSGISGEEDLKIKSNSTNEITYSVLEDENISRNLFYMVSVPRDKNYGAILVEKKGVHSIIKEIDYSLNQFFKSLGYLDYYIKVTQMPLNSYINDFIEDGVLSEINLIKNSIPMDITNPNDEERIFNGCKDIRSIKLTDSGEAIKQDLKRLYNQNFDENILVPFGETNYDEISFLIRYKGQRKTFYVKDKSKIRSDMKVILSIDGANSIEQSYFDTYYEIIDTFIFPNNNLNSLSA